MKLILATALLLALGTSAYANDTCFEVSADGKAWSKTPELLCVANVKDADYTLSLKTGLPGAQQEVLTLHLNLLNRVRCVDCNKDVFGIANPTNSIANAFQVKFDGTRVGRAMAESGTVTIGATKLFYRGQTKAPTPPPTKPAGAPRGDATMSPPTHAPDPKQ